MSERNPDRDGFAECDESTIETSGYIELEMDKISAEITKTLNEDFNKPDVMHEKVARMLNDLAELSSVGKKLLHIKKSASNDVEIIKIYDEMRNTRASNDQSELDKVLSACLSAPEEFKTELLALIRHSIRRYQDTGWLLTDPKSGKVPYLVQSKENIVEIALLGIPAEFQKSPDRYFNFESIEFLTGPDKGRAFPNNGDFIIFLPQRRRSPLTKQLPQD